MNNTHTHGLCSELRGITHTGYQTHEQSVGFQRVSMGEGQQKKENKCARQIQKKKVFVLAKQNKTKTEVLTYNIHRRCPKRVRGTKILHFTF